MTHYSWFSVFSKALSGNKGWDRAWRDPEPKAAYDVIIVGGGGHGLATAYYLAKEHGITNVAVLEKGWLGGGNTGRNTTIIRSNYMIDGNTYFYEKSLQLWEGLSKDLNYNAMVSHRQIYNLFHSPSQKEAFAKRYNIMRSCGIDGEILDRNEVMKELPYLDFSPNARFPVYGAAKQPRAGTARHDAVAWGYARGADMRGVDLIQNCEVTGFQRDASGAVVGVETTRGSIKAKKVGIAVAGHTTQVAEMAGLSLPIESHLLQAFVSEPYKPLIDTVITFGAGHFYISQSDKGGLVFGGDLDGYNSFAQRGNFHLIDHLLPEGKAMIPCLSRLRFQRTWGGIMDMTMDGSPIICKSPVDGLYINGGWCYGGFKATPGSGWCFAHTIANDRPHEFNAKLTLDRFRRGYAIDEKGAGPMPGWH
ncbi:MAG: sarcosine oxidase subunit beta family protein [Pseudomonadota bacterium]